VPLNLALRTPKLKVKAINVVLKKTKLGKDGGGRMVLMGIMFKVDVLKL
jgi:hypothetical protein